MLRVSLRQVIYQLNTKNEDLEYDLAEQAARYEGEVEQARGTSLAPSERAQCHESALPSCLISCMCAAQVLREAAERLNDLKASDGGGGKDDLPRVRPADTPPTARPRAARSYPVHLLSVPTVTPAVHCFKIRRRRSKSSISGTRLSLTHTRKKPWRVPNALRSRPTKRSPLRRALPQRAEALRCPSGCFLSPSGQRGSAPASDGAAARWPARRGACASVCRASVNLHVDSCTATGHWCGRP